LLWAEQSIPALWDSQPYYSECSLSTRRESSHACRRAKLRWHRARRVGVTTPESGVSDRQTGGAGERSLSVLDSRGGGQCVELFYDNLDHCLLLRAVRHHTELKWLHLYIERWLTAPVKTEEGALIERSRGSPQGSAISPLLANLFMHHAFDEWMIRHLPGVKFERYMDDVVIHCRTQEQAKHVLGLVRQRLKECGLDLHPEKTRIVYCKDSNRRGKYEQVRFDFLGYAFQPRSAVSSSGVHFVSFLPAISRKSRGKIAADIRSWRLHSRAHLSIDDIATMINPAVRGWMNYYGGYYRAALYPILDHLDRCLMRWVCRKYKRFRGHGNQAFKWLSGVSHRQPNLFAHWSFSPGAVAGR
jgi:RNA-directed DNA polymerase